MANSLVSRVPFLDKNILSLGFSIPTKFVANAFNLKILLKKVAIARGVPKQVLYRKKMGFGVPVNYWMANEFKSKVEEILSENEGYFRHEDVKKLWNNFLKDNKTYSHSVWAILMFKLWKKRYLDNEKTLF